MIWHIMLCVYYIYNTTLFLYQQRDSKIPQSRETPVTSTPKEKVIKSVHENKKAAFIV